LNSQSLYALGTPASGSNAAVQDLLVLEQQFNYRVNNAGLPAFIW
jgi:hypothetical protein